MKKILILVVLTMILCVVGSCEKSEEEETNTDVNREIENVAAEDFVGVGGIFFPNQVYDYSQFSKNIYEYDDGIKLPIPPIDGAKLKDNGSGMLVFYDVEKVTLEKYINDLQEYGYEIYSYKSNDYEMYYELYKDNYSIALQYSDFSDKLEGKEAQVFLFIYTGNVVKETEITIADASKEKWIIDEEYKLE